MLWTYHTAGLPVDELDLPYGVRDEHNPQRVRWMRSRLAQRFMLVSGPWVDGDVVIFGGHMGIYAGGFIYDMRKDLRRTTARSLAPFVRFRFRHQAIAGE